MGIDPSKFHLVNVVDTCGVWNVLSSTLMYGTSCGAGCDFCITETVRYECLDKPRTTPTAGEKTLMERLRKARSQGRFQSHPVDIGDLQALADSPLRNRLGKGELSSIAFAIKIGHAVLTDDQRARRYAVEIRCAKVQTTPHLLGWLVFSDRMGSTDLPAVIQQHEAVEGTLAKHLCDAVEIALQCKLNMRPLIDASDEQAATPTRPGAATLSD